MRDFLGWLSPILAAIAICAGQAIVKLGQDRLSKKMDDGERKRDEARAEAEAKRIEEAKWREDMERRMGEFERVLESQNKKIDSVLKGQLTQMRSDVTHKVHRYLDDLGCASTEEKESLYAEYKDYCAICEKFGIENHFVEQMIEKAMDLPSRAS